MSTDNQQKSREFGLTNFSLKNKTSVVILAILVTIMGISAYRNVPKESFPEIVLPTIYVGTVFPGNSPIDMENLVTRPIEKEVKGVSGIKKITSTSIQDYSTIIVEFNPDVEIPKALQDVKDAVDRSKSDLPTDLDQDPNIFEINFSEFPFMFINVAGDYKQEQLKEYAEWLQDEIEKFKEVNEVNIRGLNEKEVLIAADIQAMTRNQVSFGDIQNAVRQENVTMSAGDILTDNFRRSIRIPGEYKDPETLENLIVKKEHGKTTYLRDVAKVTFDYKEPESFARMNGQPVLTIEVTKRSGENLLDAADAINALIVRAKKDGHFPKDLDVTVTNDQSVRTRSMVSNLENSIIAGVILVVLVLLFFMGIRNALFVGLAIPLSMFISFIILSAIGFTLNMMVLFSLILALGLLVDNGIVVVENVYRLMEEGMNAWDAAKQGVGEVAMPIISSTATTLAAFLPLVFWDSIIGEFMKFLPITLIIVLTSSLFVALVFNPVFTSIFMKLQTAEDKKINTKALIIGVGFVVFGILVRIIGGKFFGGLMITFGLIGFINALLLKPVSIWFQETALVWLEEFYEKTLTFALTKRRPILFFSGSVLLFFFSIVAVGGSGLKITFFPDSDPQYINVYAEFPIGTDITYTDSLANEMEKQVESTIAEYREEGIIEAVITNVGAGTSDPSAGPQQGSSPNKARINISFPEYHLRKGYSTAQIMDEIRHDLDRFPGVTITVEKNRMGPPVGKPINIEIKGENIENLITLSDEMMTHIRRSGIEGIEELKIDLETQKPELIVHIDRERARTYGLSTSSVSQALRTALFGSEISKYKEGEDDYEINLRLKNKYRYHLSNLINQQITFRDQATGRVYQIPISAVADLEYSTSYGSIRRRDLDRVVTVYSNVEEGYNANLVVQEIKDALADYEMPEGYSFKFTGEQEEQAESGAFLGRAMMIAVFLIFLILVSQFNSTSKPFIIMASVVLSTIGVFLGLVIANDDFVIIMTGIGIISLAGIVVNNAIVLIDYTDLVRARMKDEFGLGENERLLPDDFVKAITEAGKTRLRPVLLTALTTVLGLVPLAIGLNVDFYGLIRDFEPEIYFGGDNAAFWGPMAWTVIYGLTFATFLTLVIVPVMYVLVDRMKFAIAGRKSKS
ncbi:MMPL family transporter [bacterium]|nr:MMPL family transporter [bacterium]